MKTQSNLLSPKRLHRLREQGYYKQSDWELTGLAFGIRFAYRLCTATLVLAIATQSILLFSIMFCISVASIVVPNHPFDYIYNGLLSKRMNKPRLPARSPQLVFACSMAATWLAAVIFLLATGSTTAGLVLAGTLAVTASFPATIDLCIPSLIYNALINTSKNKQMLGHSMN